MKRLKLGNTIATLGLVLALVVPVAEAEGRVVLASHGPHYQRMPATHELVLEGGLAEPAGDQKDGFFTSDNGFGAGSGYQLGVRWRHYLGSRFALGPAFHHTRFGSDAGLVSDGPYGGLAYDQRTSNNRYGLDLQAFAGEPADRIRPFLTAGVAVMHNRYRDVLEYEGVYEASVAAAAVSLGAGIKFGQLELAGEYTRNRFGTGKFSADRGPVDYNWDQISLRLGLSFGR